MLPWSATDVSFSTYRWRYQPPAKRKWSVAARDWTATLAVGVDDVGDDGVDGDVDGDDDDDDDADDD